MIYRHVLTAKDKASLRLLDAHATTLVNMEYSL
jgi:hypothetical protein